MATIKTPIVHKLGIPSSELPRIDADFGPCVQAECIKTVVTDDYDPADPKTLGCRIRLTYQNGEVIEAETRYQTVLFYGFLKCYTDEGEYACISDRRVIALVGQAAADLIEFKEGKLGLPTIEEAESIIEDYSIPTEPLQKRDGIEDEWMSHWKEEGKLCEMETGDWMIAEKVMPEFRDKIKSK